MLMISYNALNPPSAPRNDGYLPDETDILHEHAISNGRTDVFGETTFLDPVRDGLDQGYSIESDT